VLGELVEIVDQRRRFVTPPGRPFIVGVTGSVAVGKSHLATQLEVAIEGLGGSPSVSVIETDAFLRSNAELDAAGLGMKKGFPETYDQDALVAALRRLRAGKGVAIPVYSHLTYDIVVGELREVPPRDVIVVVGLHLGLFARGEIDLLIHLDAAEEDLERWFLDRFSQLVHEAADDPTSFYAPMLAIGEEHAITIGRQAWEQINLHNLREHVGPARQWADVVVLKGADHSIVAVSRQSGTFMPGW
jgi:type I pantothenate kinase